MGSLREYVPYHGQAVFKNESTSFRASHLRKLDNTGIWMEFEVDTEKDWQSIKMFFAQEKALELIPFLDTNQRALGRPEGIFPSAYNRQVVVIKQGSWMRISERHLATLLFAKLT